MPNPKKMIIHSNDKIFPVNYKDLPVDDPMQRQPDITRAKDILGWEPKVGRSEGMKKTFEYFKSLTEDELYKSEHKDFTNYHK